VKGGDSSVRWPTLAWVVAGAGVVCTVLLVLWRNSGRELPLLPWLALVPLLLLSAVVLLAGWQVRRSVQEPTARTDDRRRPARQGPRPEISPERARGTLVAAQASALGGAGLAGWYLANALLALPNADVTSVRSLLVRALVSAAGAGVLAVSGMVAQWMCRVPPSDDEDGFANGTTEPLLD
jgi:hypothetical protein